MEDNRYGYFREGNGVWRRSLRDGDFQEEDVWAIMNERSDSNSKITKPKTPSNSLPKLIPKSTKNPMRDTKQTHLSESVNIPNFPKVYKRMSKKKSSWDDDDDDSGDDDDDGYGYVIPPHEIVDRRISRNQISSFSVVEGVGRTLKGRDLSKVRNAVLTKTGFLESL